MQAWLITGANRGIGFEITKLAASHNYVVFAGVRDRSKSDALNRLALENPNVHVIQIRSSNIADAEAAAKVVEQTVGGIDVVVANAGIANNWQRATNVEIDAVLEHYKVNALSAIVLFQAFYPLLLKRQTRKFVTVSTNSASVGALINIPNTAYGSSKAALNFITRSIYKEHQEEGFIVFPIHPGYVMTDMGITATMELDTSFMVPLTPAQSGEAVFQKVDTASAEDNGRFWVYDGTELPW